MVTDTSAAVPQRVPVLIGASWHEMTADNYQAVYNPSTGELIANTPLCGAEVVDQAVQAAAEAFPAWQATPVVERARYMFRLRGLLERHFDELAQLVTTEHGKTFVEAQAEVQRGLEVVEFCCGIPSLMVGEHFPEIAAAVDGDTARFPLGVCVGITPYNFPCMIPQWMFPVALTCGNTFVLKPSEKVPLSAVRLGELLLEAGLPPGVFNIVHGGAECVQALLHHPRVAAVSFVGSTRVARWIYTTGTAAGKRVQAAGGAKNHLIVMPDADLDLSVKAIAVSAFGCTGQRCMAGSVAVPVGAVADPLVERLCEVTNHLRIGPTFDQATVDIGPLINPDAVQRMHDYLDVAVEEGGDVVVDGRRVQQPPAFIVGPSVVDRVRPDARLAREEVFGPLLSVIRADTVEAAIALGNNTSYGNGASIFTRDGRVAREFKRRFPAGMIGINVGVPAPMAWLPFTGWNDSFFGDLHMQGREGIYFYTRQKMTLTRWFDATQDSHHDPVWRSQQKRGL